jgi:glycosyltransferase involved in cell wall biosynthesis
MIQISIIIPTYNRAAPLRRALKSVVEQSYPRTDYEILVVDNASTDDTRAVAEEMMQAHREPTIRYVHEPIPGLLPARHRGVAESQGAILVFIDDDIEADRGWLAAIHDAFQDPDVHMVGGRNLPNYEVIPPAWINQVMERGPDYAVMYCGYYSLLDFGDRRLEIDANHVWGLNFSIRRETFYRLGGFNPDTVPGRYLRYQGDGETGLSIKLKQQGLKAIYEPRALVHHLVPSERLTVDYLERRMYFQGVCDSYTSIRKTEKFGFFHFLTLFPASEQEMLAYKMNTSYMCGYNWHQNEVKNDPRLLGWVLKDNYLDYRYPE